MKSRLWRVDIAEGEFNYYTSDVMTEADFLAGLDRRFIGYAVRRFRRLIGGDWVVVERENK